MVHFIRGAIVAGLAALSPPQAEAQAEATVEEITEIYVCETSRADVFHLLIARMSDGGQASVVVSNDQPAPAAMLSSDQNSRYFRVLPGRPGALPITRITLGDDLGAIVSFAMENVGQFTISATCQIGEVD